MGNIASSLSPTSAFSASPSRKTKDHPMMSFPGSTLLLDNPWCGSLRDTLASPVNSNNDDDNNSNSKKSFGGFLRHQADHLCLSGDQEGNDDVNDDIRDDDSLTDRHQPKATTSQDKNANPTSALFARALVSEVTNNPNTMTPKLMAEREKRLLKAQDAARKQQQQLHNSNGSEASANIASGKPVGAPGGIGQASFLGSLAYVLGATASPTNSDTPKTTATGDKTSILPPNSIQENRAQAASNAATPSSSSKYSVTIGLSLSRRHSTQGHPDTVTRQTAFDFNELQDRQYKYVSSTDSSGWMAGGGERGGSFMLPTPSSADYSQGANSDDLPEDFEGSPKPYQNAMTVTTSTTPKAASTPTQHQVKIAAPDTVHIPIIQIDADSPAAVDAIIGALARGEVFIPHMAVLPEALSVNGISPPDLVVRFGCERNEDVPPEEWPNWCLEFMHNQLYEYFFHLGARWTKRPFHITLAKKVRWKTVKHMNRYFAHAERVIDAWREKGPQYLDPQLSYIEGGATPEEVGRPHGIYLMRNGIPTNYFPPNFDPPYTTKMTRSLLLNVLGKSWNKQRREWSGDPIPRLITPAVLMATMCGCADPTPGFLATEVTQVSSQPIEHSNISEQRVVTHDDMLSSHKGNDQLEGTGVSSKPSTETFRTMEGDPVFAPMLQSQQQQQQQTADTFVEHRQGSVESIQLTESPARRQGGDVDEAPTTTNEAQNDEDHAQKMSKSIPVFGKDNSPLTAASMMLSPHGDGSVLSPFGQGFVDDDEERVAAAEAYPFDDDNNVREEKKMADEPLNGHLPYIKQQQHPGYVDHHHQTAPLLSGREADPPSPGPHRTREATLAELVSTDALVTPDLFAESKLESKGSGTLGRGPTPERLRILPIETRHQVTADEQAMSPSVLSESDDDESGAFFHEQLTTPKSELPQLSSQIADTAVASSDILELNSTTASSSTVAHLNLSPAKLVQREFERKMAREGKQLLNGSSPDGGYGSPSSKSASDRKVKKDKETIERERSLHIAMIAIAQDNSSQKSQDHIQRYLKDPRKVELARALMEAEKARSPQRGSPSRTAGSPSLQRANSGISLDYSIDSSLLGDGSTTLAGSVLATDASVGTANSRRTQRSTGTTGTFKGKKIAEEDDGSVSIQESYSGSGEPVPNDEDLFAIGWAKALDAKSGSYYYFTLDRTKIVWDNPLAPHTVESAGSADSISLPPGSAMI